MNRYQAMKARHQVETNAFPMFFAFSDKQFVEAMKKLGLEPDDTDKVYSLGGTGGIYRKSDAPALHDMWNRQASELSEAMKDISFAAEAFEFELENHEFIITYDTGDAIEALGLTIDEIEKNPILSKALKKAIKSQQEWKDFLPMRK
jgi:hypothetical protein